jgi:hypothetical protein
VDYVEFSHDPPKHDLKGCTFDNLYVHELFDIGAYDGSFIWLCENLDTRKAELWRTCDLTRIERRGQRVNKCKYGAHGMYGGASAPVEVGGMELQGGEQWWAIQKHIAQARLKEITTNDDVGEMTH